MITYLRLQNFRRHAHTEIHFQEGDHLILIAGRNGYGKTSLLEGLVFALYGESRHGRTRLDSLIRRGAELEGMEAEIRFTMGGSEYQVVRRRDGRSSTAVMYGDGVPLVESPTAVTEAVTRLFGMDSQGFRMAVFAQQKELDGLATLTPTVRRRMVGRLLRLDVVARARDLARSAYVTAKDVVAALGPSADVEAAEQAVAAAKQRAEATAAALAEAEKSLTEAAEVVAKYASVETDLAEIRVKAAAAAAEVEGARRRVENLESELAQIPADPPMIEVPADRRTIAEGLEQVEKMLARHEAAVAEAARVAALAKEHARDLDRIEEIREELTTLASEETLAAAVAELDAVDAELAEAEERGRVAADVVSRAAERLRAAEEAVLRAENLGDHCEDCGQEIGDDHRCQILAQRQATAEKARGSLAEAEKQAEAATAALADLRARRSDAAARAEQLRREVERRSHLEGELSQMERRVRVYSKMSPSSPEPEDAAGLLEWRGALRDALRRCDEADAAEAERRRLADLRSRVERDLTEARTDLEAAEKRQAEAVASDEMLEAAAELEAARARVEDEREIVAATREEAAVAATEVRAAEAALAVAKAEAERRRQAEHRGVVAQASAELLEALRDTLVREVRPALEGTVSQALDALSEGRFSRIHFSDTYEISVEDNGDVVPLSELSGGETDLVALAVRLGLAEMVAERHGSGGIGFLVLDECFGSQDPTRRQAILSGLRNLRSTYSQIFLISHVGGLEDHVDLVLQVNDNDGVAEVVAA